ncbi:MAG: arsinothricin resistance N-acetyltransferase ArsN1 family A [Thermomicrobiales bacterium]
MHDIVIRPATLDDAAAIAEIYNQGIRGRNATFETEERTADERRAWLAAHDEHHPTLVATVGSAENAVVAGWVSASDYRPRECYRGIAEFSVYVHNDHHGKGVGRKLMDAFIPACTEAGLWKILSRIFPENKASLALCKAVGFKEVGIYEKHSYLDGVWRDVVIVERLFPENITDPPPDPAEW